MVNVTATALSGFQASERKLAVAADNIANATTPEYKAKEVEQSSVAGGGVTTRVTTPERAASEQPTTDAASAPEASNVSLDKELVNVNIATYSAQANLKVIQAQDKQNKYLLDIQA